MIPGETETLVITNLEPYNKELKSSKAYLKTLATRKARGFRHSGYENLIRNPLRKGVFGDSEVSTGTMDYWLYPEIQQLCRGDMVFISIWLKGCAKERSSEFKF